MASLNNREESVGTEVVDGEAPRSEGAPEPLLPPPTISSLGDGEGASNDEEKPPPSNDEEIPHPPSMVTTQLPSAPNSGNMTATIMAALEDMSAKDDNDSKDTAPVSTLAPSPAPPPPAAPAPAPLPAPVQAAPAPAPTFVSSLPPPPQVAPLPPPPTMPGTVKAAGPASTPSQQSQPPQQFRPTPLPPLPPPPPPPARTVPPLKTPSAAPKVGGEQPMSQHSTDRVDNNNNRREKALTPPNLGAMAAAAIPATSAIFSNAAATANNAATAFATAASSTAAEAMAGAAAATSTAAGALSEAAVATSSAAGAVAATAASSSNPLSPRRIISSVASPPTATSAAPASSSASKAANATLSPRARVFPNASVTPSKGNSTGRRRRSHTFVPQPAPSNLASLAKRQYEIPVLVVPTAESKAMVWEKNRLTVPDLFTAMANSIVAPKGLDSNGNVGLYPPPPRLPTLRSVGKTLSLTWDAMRLRFVDGETIAALSDSSYVETELNDSALVWEGDGDLQNELFQLERRVGTLISSSSDGVAAADDDEEHEEEHTNQQVDDGTFIAKEDPVKAAAKQAFGLSSPPNVPWLLRFRDALDRTTSYLPHDNIGSPPVCVLVSSTSDAGPLDCLSELSNVLHLPRPYQNGLFDSNGMRREYVLLHDEVDGPADFNESAYVAEMQRRFGPGCCAVLRINSVRPVTESEAPPLTDASGSPNGNEDPVWDAVLPSPSPPQRSHEVASYNRGMCLSENDKATLRRYLATLVTSSLIPAMERRIANLNVIVSNAKKGVKNVFKSLWRKPRESGLGGGSSHGAPPDGIVAAVAEEDQELVKYRHDTIESQTLLLANTLFLMRDYESSLGIYRLVKDDYKSDRNLLHYASVHEMMALCIYMLDPQGNRFGRELFTDFETALYSYTRAADDDRAAGAKAPAQNPEALPATRLTTRLCLVISSTQALCEGRHLEIADLLASASSHESPLGAAVLLEQAAAHYYHAEMCRKFAFHMLMAGHMFRSASQEHHAFRCFTSALFVYHDGRWEELHNHLRSALAAQLYGMRRMAMSLQLYSKLVGMTGGGRVSVRSQQKFLNHLIDICRRHSVDALVGSDRMRQDRGGVTTTKAGLFRTGSVEDVLIRTPNATRAVEIYGMDLPRVDDSSVSVTAGAVSASVSSVASGGQSTPFGTLGAGAESVWKDMMMSVQAELHAEKDAAKNSDGQIPQGDAQESEVLANADPLSARVVSVFNREKADAALLASRRKKSGGAASPPEKRARMEPITVSFTMSNPLSVQIRLTEIQLVASFKGSATDETTQARICTNEDAIDISVVGASESADGENATATPRSWKFHSSTETFQVANFTRLSPVEVDPEIEGDDEGNKPSGTELTPWTSAVGLESPFFVVTKSKAEIDPGTTIRIALSICPLVTGDLEILGMRCKLFNEVWVYHKFKILGPLLQDTAVNRAKRARGESSMLKSKVGGDMPNLAVEFVPTENSGSPAQSVAAAVLQGQTVDWSIRVANLGTAPASNVTLKTNSPWLIVRDNKGREVVTPDSGWERESTSHSVGPTGTLLRLPLRKIHSNGDGADDILQPGEVADVHIRLRTMGVGSQGFYMLFRYELFSSGEDSGKLGSPQHRWMRKMITVPVYPSLSLGASLMPSYWMKREHLLSVEITNYRTDNQTSPFIFLDSLCIASRHFRVRQLPGQISASGGDNGGLGDLQKVGGRLVLPIGWQERVTFHYVVSPLESDDGTFVLSRCHVGGGSEDVVVENFVRDTGGARVTDFLCLDVADNKFRILLDEHSKELARLEAEQEQEGSGPRSISAIRRARSGDPNFEFGGYAAATSGSDAAQEGVDDKLTSVFHPTSLNNLCPPKSTEAVIHVMCVWAAPENGSDRLVNGHHQLHNLTVRPHRQSKGCPLTITAKHKNEVSHDFGLCPLRLDLEVTVRNRLVESVVKFDFAVEPHPEFEFVGAESFSWSLEGGEEVVVPLQAVIPRSGIYNLQKIRLTVKGSDEEGSDIPYLFPLQWVVRVTAL